MDRHLQTLRREATLTGDPSRLIHALLRAYGSEPAFDQLYELMQFPLAGAEPLDAEGSAWPWMANTWSSQKYYDYGYPIPHVFNYLRGYEHGATSQRFNQIMECLETLCEEDYPNLKIVGVHDLLEISSDASLPGPAIERRINLVNHRLDELSILIMFHLDDYRWTLGGQWDGEDWGSQLYYIDSDYSKEYLIRILDDILRELQVNA